SDNSLLSSSDEVSVYDAEFQKLYEIKVHSARMHLALFLWFAGMKFAQFEILEIVLMYLLKLQAELFQ
ncbi:unnamed protein product, partial [Ceratitis capitata]